jgi:hypothetical protein
MDAGNEKDFLDILEQLAVILASVAGTAEFIAHEVREFRKSREEGDGTDEDNR